jgi:Lar family restriction alleviation protein
MKKKINSPEKLLPCPFCGCEDAWLGEDSYTEDKVTFHVSCPMPVDGGCGAEIAGKHTRKEAIRCWNRRAVR